MAMKLYPPLIEGTIPAFGGTVITVPFALNKAVARTEIAGLELKIKTVQGSTLLGTFEAVYFDVETEMIAQFNISSILSALHIGQYYKVQLAFIGPTNTVGYYSTVGVVKYTAVPEVYIEGLTVGEFNNHTYHYTAVYSQLGGDQTEKLYSTRFKLLDNESHVVVDSGEILHNINNDDVSYEAHEEFIIAQDLEDGENYYLFVTMTTSNGMVISSDKYRMTQVGMIATSLKADLVAINNFDDGYIAISLHGHTSEDGVEYGTIGTFALCRAASNENYIWHEVVTFSISDSKTSRQLWQDYTVEQGVTYRYSIQEFNSYNIYSERIISNDVVADFEDAFLYDGQQQLKIRYNPKVSSFKTDLQESKVETIGSKYPFIFRNGQVRYREFPISGLISYFMDENEKFMSKKAIGLEEITQNLTTNNIFAERNFKMSVLDWLNNGKTKLFRSPGEGNFIVQLLNVSMSPTDSVGRMLHTFSSTAYEVNDFSYNALLNEGLLSTENLNVITPKWATIELASHSTDLDTILESLPKYIAARVPVTVSLEMYSRIINANPDLKRCFEQYGLNSYAISVNITKADLEAFDAIRNTVTYVTNRINSHEATSIDIRDMVPGTIVEVLEKGASEPQQIQIGVTGAYKANFDVPVVSISIPTPQVASKLVTTGLTGSITYSYYSKTENVFNLISNYKVTDVPSKQWIGTPSKTIYDFKNNKVTSHVTNNLIEVIEDSKITISKIFSMRFLARPLREIFIQAQASDGSELVTPTSGPYYFDMDCTDPVDLNKLDPYYVYAICHARFDYTYKEVPWEGYFIYANYNHGYYVDKNGKEWPVFKGWYLDGRSTSSNIILYDTDSYHNTVTINGDTIDLTEIEKYQFRNFNDKVDSIYFDNGVICEMSFQTRTQTYDIENSDRRVNAAKLLYESEVRSLQALRKWVSLDWDFKKALDAVGNNTSSAEGEAIIEKYTKLKQECLSILGFEPTLDTVAQAEERLLSNIQIYYEAYIYQLNVALYSYEKELNI